MTEYEQRLMLSFFLAAVIAPMGSGWMYQSLYYILIILLGGFANDYEKWMSVNVLYLVVILWAGVIRATSGRK